MGIGVYWLWFVLTVCADVTWGNVPSEYSLSFLPVRSWEPDVFRWLLGSLIISLYSSFLTCGATGLDGGS